MKKEITIMKKGLKISNILFVLFYLLSNSILSQNEKHLKIKLEVEKKLPLIKIENVTSDTIILFSKLKMEDKERGAYILGYEKKKMNYKNGVLKKCYHCIKDYLYLGNIEKSRIKIAPYTYIITYLPYLYQGEYYFKIQTFYGYKGKRYLWNVKTNKIKILSLE